MISVHHLFLPIKNHINPPAIKTTTIIEPTTNGVSSYREDARDMTVNVSDNTAVKSVEVMIDGKSAAVYDQAEIEKAGGKIDYTLILTHPTLCSFTFFIMIGFLRCR